LIVSFAFGALNSWLTVLEQNRLYVADGGADVRDVIEKGGEPMIPHVQRLFGTPTTGMSVGELWTVS
jgi:hypothetical protein